MQIYLIYNTISGKYYIGKTERELNIRIAEHFYPSNETYRLQNAIRKYGKEIFIIQTLSTAASSQALNELEMLWICALNSHDPEVGYNMTYGGDSGIPTAYTRKKISEKLKGRVITPEWKQKLSDFNKGKKASLETKLKMSLSSDQSSRKGVPRTEEVKRKISLTKKANPKPHKHSLETRKAMSIARKLLWQKHEYRAYFLKEIK